MLRLKFHDLELSVSQLPSLSEVPSWAFEGKFWSVTKTESEVSIITETAVVPQGVKSQPGWIALEVVGPLDFGLVGILSHLLAKFAEINVPVFCVSTYDCDYVIFDEKHRGIVMDILGADERYDVS